MTMSHDNVLGAQMKFVDERTLSIFAPSREAMDDALAKIDEAMTTPDPEV